MKILENINIDIPQQPGKAFLTAVMGGRLNEQIEAILKEKSIICIKNIEPKLIFEKYEIDKIIKDKVYFKSGNIFTGPNISRILKSSETAIIFVQTLGKHIDEIIAQESKKGDTLNAIIMDAITTDLLERLGEATSKIIKSEGIIKEDWSSTCSYSPGQYKWTIEEQKEIFSMISPEKIGVKLNSSFLMEPFKSSSGVYGFGPENLISKIKVACEICPKLDCIDRKV
jgi:hypothetical protein